jgi:formylglycine-generating enzyme
MTIFKVKCIVLLIVISTAVPTKAQPVRKVGLDTLRLGGITFVRIPGGSFAMGDDSSQEEIERPVHRVTISTFWVARTEITFRQWKAFLDQSGYPAGRSTALGPDHPVVSITWDDAQAYCRWFSEKYAVNMRLPTEAEWEYAARGGLEGKDYPNGDTISAIEANYASNGPGKVAQYKPNGYGLYDMAGNVFEWTGDWFDREYYKISPAIDPRGPATENGKLQRRVDRGGGWCMGVEKLRVSSRHAGPGSWDEGGTAECLGFRPVLEAKTSNKK